MKREMGRAHRDRPRGGRGRDGGDASTSRPPPAAGSRGRALPWSPGEHSPGTPGLRLSASRAAREWFPWLRKPCSGGRCHRSPRQPEAQSLPSLGATGETPVTGRRLPGEQRPRSAEGSVLLAGPWLTGSCLLAGSAVGSSVVNRNTAWLGPPSYSPGPGEGSRLTEHLPPVRTELGLHVGGLLPQTSQ